MWTAEARCARPATEGQGCTRGEDCDSGVCDAKTKRCTTAQCDDGIKNGDETDVDCGGSCPNGCDNGQGCRARQRLHERYL